MTDVITVNRREFLSRLEIGVPALACNDLIPVITHFCFTGDRVTSFNDQIAIEVPLKAKFFHGSTPGTTITNLLKNSKAKNIVLTANKDELRCKAASTVVKLPLVDAEDFSCIFSMPETSDKDVLQVSAWEDFISALTLCLRSTGIDAAFPEHLGISLVPSKKSLMVYSSNENQITRASVKLKSTSGLKDRVILSVEFCKQLINLCGDKAPKHFEINGEHALLVTKGGIKLFGRIIECAHPTDFEELIKDHLPDDYLASMIPVPSKMSGIFKRASVIMDQGGAVGVKVQRKNDTVRILFNSESDKGVLRDFLTVTDHPPCSASFYPKLVESAIGVYDSMLFTDRAAVFSSGNVLHLVSAFGD